MSVWNDAEIWYATNLTGTGELTNSSYIQNATLESADYDNNSNAFTSYFYGGTDTGTIASVAQNGVEDGDGCESMLVSLEMSDDFPIGQTIITAKATISGYIEIELVGQPDIAKAEGIGRYSVARIAVNVAEASTPTPTPTPTATETSTPEELPVTGASSNNSSEAQLLLAIVALFSSTGVLVLCRLK